MKRVKHLYKKYEKTIKYGACIVLGVGLSVGGYYLNKKIFNNNGGGASILVDVCKERPGEVIIEVSYQNKKGDTYKYCGGAWSSEDAIKIGNDIIDVANIVLNKEKEVINERNN